MKFLQPDGIKTEVGIAAWVSPDGKARAIHWQQLGWTRSRPEALNQGLGRVCAVVSEHCREVHGKLFAFLANGQSPAEPRLESDRLEPGLQPVQYHVGRRRGRTATQANLRTGRKPWQSVAIRPGAR